MSAMHVLKNVKDTNLTIASNAHKHVVAVQKNVEGWLGNNQAILFFDEERKKIEDAKRLAAFWASYACCH
jgi:hypothetical protein